MCASAAEGGGLPTVVASGVGKHRGSVAAVAEHGMDTAGETEVSFSCHPSGGMETYAVQDGDIAAAVADGRNSPD